MKIRLIKNITLSDLLGIEPAEMVIYPAGTEGNLIMPSLSVVGYSIVHLHGFAPFGNQDWCIANDCFEYVTDNQ